MCLCLNLLFLWRHQSNWIRAPLNDLILKKFINLAALGLSWGFFGGSDGEESACSVGDLGSIPGLGRSPGEGHGYPLQYSCLENSMDRGAWRATVHCVLKSRTWLGLSCGIEVFDLSCGAWDLVPWPGIELRLPALGVRSLSHWTTREVPSDLIFTELPPLKSLSPNRVQILRYCRRRRGWQRKNSIIDSMDMSLSKLQEMVKDSHASRKEAWRATVHGVTELDVTEWLNNSRSCACTMWILKGYNSAHNYVNRINS